MTTFSWPATSGWVPNEFKMFVKPNERVFTGYYAGQSQALDILGEYWCASLVIPVRNDNTIGASIEAFFNRLRGRSNLVSLWHLKRPAPLGTMRGAPTVSGAVAQLANTLNIQSTAGATLLAGDMLGIGSQVSQVMANATADGSGLFTGVEIFPRARTAISGGSSVSWDKPTVSMRLSTGDGIPVMWVPGNYGQIAVDLIEA